MTIANDTALTVAAHESVVDITDHMQVGTAFYAALPTAGFGWCTRCLADLDDPACCSKARTDRLVAVPSKWCGCLQGDLCTCAALEVGAR